MDIRNYRTIFFLVAAIMLLIMLPIAWSSGISGDERIQYEYGQAILDWFLNFGETTEANKIVIESHNGIHTYSSSFDFLTATFNELFGIEKEYEFRHLFNALTGWFLILFAGLIAQQILGWRAAIITIVFLFLSPRLLGHSWNNPKDIPFAMTYIMGIYFIMRYTLKQDEANWKDKLFVALAIGSSIGIRIGGLLLIAYLFLFVGLYFLYRAGSIKEVFSATSLQRMRKIAVSTIVVAVLAYIFGIMLWPFALDNPIENPLIALSEMSNYAIRTGIRQLYDKNIVWSDDLPAYYTIQYIFMTTPVFIILSFFASLFFLGQRENKDTRFWKFVLLFAFIFPIFYIFWKESMVYSGWRHTLFTYPTMAISAALGIEYLLRKLKSSKQQVIVMSILPILLIHPLIHTVKNSPFQYIYFNEIIGGVNNTYGVYENDYYYHSSKEAYDWLIENHDFEETKGRKLQVATNDYFSLRYFMQNDTNQKPIYKRYYERGDSDWDYYICVNNYINPNQLRKGLWPPQNTVYEVKVDDITIGAVLKRVTTKDVEGLKAINAGDYNTGIQLLNQAIQEDPMVESAYLNLAEAYMKVGQFDLGTQTINRLLKVYPKYDKAHYTQSIIYLNQGKLKESVVSSKKVLKLNPKFDNAYYIMSLAYMQAGDLNSSLKYIKLCLEGMPNFKQGYVIMAEIYKQQGKTQEAEYYSNIANQL